MHLHGVEIRIDDPDKLHAGVEVLPDFFVDVFQLVGGRKDFNGQQWCSVNQRRFVGLASDYFRGETGDINADRRVRVVTEDRADFA